MRYKRDSSLKDMHIDLLTAQKSAYNPSGLMAKNFLIEPESEVYGACVFEMHHRCIKFRVGKTTPIKTGQFVTLWKREGMGEILPHDMEDPVDIFVVSVRDCENFGQFVFPKEVLCEKGVISKNRKGGKRAMRVYPPWNLPKNRQAQKTQNWQLMYFFDIPLNEGVDVVRIRKLFLL